MAKFIGSNGRLILSLVFIFSLMAGLAFWRSELVRSSDVRSSSFSRPLGEVESQLKLKTHEPERPDATADGLAVFTVTKTADTDDGVCDADCSLREAIALAQNGDTITFSALFNTPQTIDLLTSLPNIGRSLTIQGPGANLLTIRRDSTNPNNRFRIFGFTSGITVALSGLTIANGDAFTNEGGGVRNFGSLTITNCAITGNRAVSGVGSVMAAR